MGNTSPYAAADYDNNIERTVPYYSFFYRQTLDLVAALGLDAFQWLDCGCGTGTMAEMALTMFPQAQFTLCDPSEEMVGLAKRKLSGEKRVKEYRVIGTEGIGFENRFDDYHSHPVASLFQGRRTREGNAKRLSCPEG